MTGLALIAVLKTLTVLGSAESYAEESAPQEAAVFARADRILAAQNGRRAKWERYLGLMGRRESRPSLASVRYRLAVGRKVYSFTTGGRLFADGRFVRDDEVADVLEIERIFRETLSRSPWKGDKLRVARDAAMELRGFEDARFARLDGPIERVVGEFNARRKAAAHGLSPVLFKSFVVEESYWQDGEPSEDELRAALARLCAAGTDGKGRFLGWNIALRNLHDADFAQRVVSRADNPEAFVPAAIWKEGVK